MANNISVEQVKKLNQKIEELNTQGTKAKARLEVMEGNLEQALADYKSTYGVELKGKTAKSTATLIQREVDRVTAEVQAEYELRKNIVEAIERGDIDEANRLLGIQPEEASEEPSEEDELFDEDDSVEDEFNEEEFFAESDRETIHSDADETSDTADFGDFDFEDLEAGSGSEEDDTTQSFSFGGLGGISFEDDEEDVQPPPAVAKPAGKKSAKTPEGIPAKDVVQNLTGNSVDIYGDFDIDEEEDFGFGDLLSGTKFTG